MRLLRFIVPFLFVRNWHTGVWEFSRARLVLALALCALLCLAIGIALMLQAPVVYSVGT